MFDLLMITIPIVITIICIIFITVMYIIKKRKSKKYYESVKFIVINKPDEQNFPNISIETRKIEAEKSSQDNIKPDIFILPSNGEFEIDKNNIEFQEIIKTGQFSKLIKGTLNNRNVILKQLLEPLSDETIINFCQEIEIKKMIGNHRNLVDFIGCCTKETPFYIIDELPFFGSLQKYLKVNKNLSNTKLLQFAFQICKGLEYLMEKKVSRSSN